ncbi:LysR family transcriptional regulator ArgP [Acidocella sp.]|uniref:LysR family transcriptional regulator ArgP n=1 Tax=Acidocella sp. TaxID=50710 RepID=UPI0026023587|nr:LysR family transcriptional regulator ArgP [Acidocella sp.]
MLDYAALSALSAVIAEGSFERAALSLGLTPSAISQRVKGLEDRLGAVLVVRGQPCTATPPGRRLIAHLARVRLLEAGLTPALTGLAAPPTIGLAVNADSLATWFPAAAARFGAESGALLSLTLDDEAHTAGRLRNGEVLAAITSVAAPVPGCKTTPLGALRYAACASPAFMAREFPHGVTQAALAQAPHLRFDRRDNLQSLWAQAAHGQPLTGPSHFVPSTQGFLDLTLHGLAWGVHPVALVAPHLATGRLTELPPAHRIEVHLYWTVARLHSAVLAKLTRAVLSAARTLAPPESA